MNKDRNQIICEQTDLIMNPLDRDSVCSIFRSLQTSGRLETMDESWKEDDAADSGDVDGIMKNAVWCHIFSVLFDNPTGAPEK